ncbi:MAG: efflux RND transporter permease subunit [Bacteroidales bacterium]|nr:efflux RND transporter permease subunit [Bacteroidales bacterium]
MKKLVALFVKYPFYANIIIGILLLAGGLSVISMNKSFFPERSSRNITISVFYPGASPEQMEEGITMRIEQAIRGIVGIREITSTSSENSARVNIETTGEYDIDETLMEVKNAVDGISGFPVDAERPIISKQRSITSALRLGLYGNVDLLTLKKHADDIEQDFLNSGIVSQVQISGYPPLEISVETSEEDLLRYNLTFDQIAQAISQNNRDFSAGLLRSDEQEILIRARERSVDPDEIGNIIIRARNDGSYLRIRDIATVKLQFSEDPNRTLINGDRAISINVNKLPEEDLSEISDYVIGYAEEFTKSHSGITLEVTFDYLDILWSRLNLLLKNGGIGLLLVLIALGIFLSLRLSGWVAWGIPASFLAMFIVANLSGITINMISLFGMILVIGILVDDGIVIAENIYSHFEEGKSPGRAAIDGTMEVMPAVATSVTTTMIAFSPLLFLEGRMEFMYEMAFVVIFSLLFSLVEAFFVLPAHVGNPRVLSREKLLKRRNGKKGIHHRLENSILNFRNIYYGAFLRYIIRWKYIFLALPIGLFIITIGLFRGGIIQTTFFPAVSFDTFRVDVAFTPGSGEKKTLEYLKEFEQAVWQVNDSIKEQYNDTSDYVTYTFLSLGNSFNGTEIGAHAGNINVILDDMEDEPVNSFQISTAVKEKIGTVKEAEKFTVGGFNRWGSPVAVSLLGRNLDELKLAKEFLITRLEEYPELKNITDNNAIGKREIRLDLKPKAYFLGMDHASVARQVRQGFYGGQAQRLQRGVDEVRVWVRYPEEGRQYLGQLEETRIKTPNGDYPLNEIADYHIERGPVNIEHFNGEREVRVDADMVDPYAPVPPILERIQKNIITELKVKYPGVGIKYQGQQKESARAGQDMAKYFSVAFGIIILILIMHFRSVTQALIVLLMIPLALLGAAWGHSVHGSPISMLSAWGMVALTGVIINDAVVFLSKYNTLLAEGNSVWDAVYKAGIARFRPILLTTITTTIGLYPIILEESVQAQFLIPMAISLAYGVLIGTGFMLLFFPVLILVLNDIRFYTKWLWTGVKPTREEVETAIRDSKRRIE